MDIMEAFLCCFFDVWCVIRCEIYLWCDGESKVWNFPIFLFSF